MAGRGWRSRGRGGRRRGSARGSGTPSSRRLPRAWCPTPTGWRCTRGMSAPWGPSPAPPTRLRASSLEKGGKSGTRVGSKLLVMEYEGAGALPSTLERGSASKEPPVSLTGMKYWCSEEELGLKSPPWPLCASVSPSLHLGQGQSTLTAGPHEREPPPCGWRLLKDLPGHLTPTPHQRPLPNHSSAKALLALLGRKCFGTRGAVLAQKSKR